METDYYKILALSKSTIPAILRSPAHFLYAFETEKKQTPQMKRGSLIHLLLYQPDDFPALYDIYNGPTSGKGSRLEKDAFEDECEKRGVEIVTKKDLDEASRVVEFLLKDPIVRVLMKDAQREVPFVSIHPDYGAPVKGIFDTISPRYISDLKTTTVGAEAWKRRGLDAQTYIQIAWYRMLGILMDGIERKFAFKVIDITPPYELYVVYPDEDLIKLASQKCKQALIRFTECLKTNQWPHNQTQIVSWSVPYYLRSQLDDSDSRSTVLSNRKAGNPDEVRGHSRYRWDTKAQDHR